MRDLREEIADIESLGYESEQALESFAFIGVEFAVEERSYVYVFRIVVEVSIRPHSEHHRRCFAQALRARELREHLQFLLLYVSQ